NLLQPLLMGKAVDIHPLGVFLGVAAGVLLAGIPGALFAIPIIAFVNATLLYPVGRDPTPALPQDTAPAPPCAPVGAGPVCVALAPASLPRVRLGDPPLVRPQPHPPVPLLPSPSLAFAAPPPSPRARRHPPPPCPRTRLRLRASRPGWSALSRRACRRLCH